MIQADVLGRFPLPVVRVIFSGVPRGVAWSLHGGAGDDEWLVASGVGDGFEVVTADPWAPLGAPASYTLRHGSTVESAGPVVRRFRGHTAVTDLTGRVVVEALWMRDAGDPRESERRAHFSQVAGSRFAPARLDPVAGAGTGSLGVRVESPHTATMRKLLAVNRPLVLLHNADRCNIRGCDVQPSRTIAVTSDSNDLTSRMDRGERLWSLSYRLLPSGVRDGVVPVVTLGDLKAAFPTLAALKASGLTLGQLKRGDWTVSGLEQVTAGRWVRNGGGMLTEVSPGRWTLGGYGIMRLDETGTRFVIKEIA